MTVPTCEAATMQLAERAARRQAIMLPEFSIDENAPLAWDDLEVEPVPSRWPRRIWPLWIAMAAVLGWFAYGAGRDFALRRLAPTPRQSMARLRTIPGTLAWNEAVAIPPAARNRSFADTLLVAIPVGRRVDQRIPSMAIRPSQRTTPEFDSAVRSIESIGGDLTFARADGSFTLKLPVPAQFSLWVVTSAPSDSAEAPRPDLAQIGHLFVPAYDLIAGKIYSLQEVYIDRNTRLELKVP